MDTVLFVDDEINILNSLRRGLLDVEYRCLFVLSGQEALNVMEKENVSVLVTDMRMPGMDGLTLLKAVKEKYPKTVRIVLSGYTQLQQIMVTINQADIFKFITKPWKMEEEIKVVIDQAIEYYRLQVESEELKKSLENKNKAYQKILRNIDEVIAGAKADVQIAKSLGSHTLDSIGALIGSGKSQEEITEEFNTISKAYRGMMEAASAEYKEINLVEELESYVEALEKRKQISKVDFINSHRDKKIRIKPELLAFLMETAEEHFIYNEEKYYLQLRFEYKTSQDTGSVELTILISRILDNKVAVLNEMLLKNIDNRISMFNTYIYNMTKLYNINVSAARSDLNIGVKLQL